MSLFSNWTRTRATARLIDRLKRTSDRRLADIGIARRDIERVSIAAYPSATVSAVDLRVRSPLVFAGAHG